MTHTLLKSFIKYASLNVLGMLGISCYILADTFFIANGVGPDGLTALNLAIPVYSFVHGIALMLGVGGATRYTIFRSQKNTDSANLIFTGTILLSVLFAALFFLAGLFCSDTITTLLGANAEVYAMTKTYLKIILLFSPAFLLNEVLLCFVRNDGGPGLSMLAMVGGSFANIVFDYIFIFPMHMGIFGAVIATAFSPIFSLLILSAYRLKKKNQFHLVKMRPQPSLLFSVLPLGFSSLVNEISYGVVMIVLNRIILGISGNIGVAAYGVVANLFLVILAVYNGIAQGIQPLFSHAYGTGCVLNIRRLLRYALTTVVILSALIYSTSYAFAGSITALFNNEHNAQLQQIAERGLKLYFTGIVFAGINIIFTSFFSSIAKAIPAQVISLLRGLLLILPFTIVLSALLGIDGVWLAFPITECLVMLLSFLLCRRCSKEFLFQSYPRE